MLLGTAFKGTSSKRIQDDFDDLTVSETGGIFQQLVLIFLHACRIHAILQVRVASAELFGACSYVTVVVSFAVVFQ